MVSAKLNDRLKQVLTLQRRPQTHSIEEGNLGDRWSDAIEDVLTMNKLVRYFETVSEYHADPEDKLYAMVQLAIYFQGEKDMEKKVTKLKLRVRQASLREKAMAEIYLSGRQLYSAFTPEAYGQHTIWFTIIFTVIISVIFFYMAADFANYTLLDWGPHTMKGIFHRTFDFPFLVSWNGFYAVKVAQGQSRRWFTSTFLHESIWHLSANILLLNAVSIHVERLYGTSRIVFTAFLSAMGGLFISATFEDPCTVVVGASGMIFGITGLWIADMIVNFHHHKRPMLQVVMVAAFFALFAISMTTSNFTSNFSHIGGLITGICPALFFLPKFGHRRIEAILPFIGLSVTFLIFLIFPLYVYLHRFKDIVCKV